MALEVNLPSVVEEIRSVFSRYEAALVANDLGTLDELFWDDPSTVRFGLADVQYGFDEVAAFRRAQRRQTPPRALIRTTITTFGHDLASVTTEFAPEGDDRAGRQSQVWVRTEHGWRVVSAHVSRPS